MRYGEPIMGHGQWEVGQSPCPSSWYTPFKVTRPMSSGIRITTSSVLHENRGKDMPLYQAHMVTGQWPGFAWAQQVQFRKMTQAVQGPLGLRKSCLSLKTSTFVSLNLSQTTQIRWYIRLVLHHSVLLCQGWWETHDRSQVSLSSMRHLMCWDTEKNWGLKTRYGSWWLELVWATVSPYVKRW